MPTHPDKLDPRFIEFAHSYLRKHPDLQDRVNDLASYLQDHTDDWIANETYVDNDDDDKDMA